MFNESTPAVFAGDNFGVNRPTDAEYAHQALPFRAVGRKHRFGRGFKALHDEEIFKIRIEIGASPHRHVFGFAAQEIRHALIDEIAPLSHCLARTR